MKDYNDPDPLHGNGKAVPHPKRPNPVRSNRAPSPYVGHFSHKLPCCTNGCRTTRQREAKHDPVHTNPHAESADAQE